MFYINILNKLKIDQESWVILGLYRWMHGRMCRKMNSEVSRNILKDKLESAMEHMSADDLELELFSM